MLYLYIYIFRYNALFIYIMLYLYIYIFRYNAVLTNVNHETV